MTHLEKDVVRFQVLPIPADFKRTGRDDLGVGIFQVMLGDGCLTYLVQFGICKLGKYALLW